MIKCSNCSEDFEINQPGHFQLDYTGTGDCDVLCSLACLTEWAWKLRDKQPKLSKSKPTGHAKTCPAYGNYQPPYEECDCGYEV